MSRRSEDNLTNKIKKVLGLSKDKEKPIAFQKSSTKEIIFTPERLREIGPESPANNRLKTIRELSDVVLVKRLEENAIEALWHSIKDLVKNTAQPESRAIALQFLRCLLQGQHQYLGILRAYFFHVIENLSVASDTAYKLELLIILSEHGRNLHEFEEDAGPFLLRWMPDVLSSGKIKEYLELIVNVIKFNAAYLDEYVVSGIVKQTCLIPDKTRSDEICKGCLDVLNAVLCYSFLPTECLDYFIAALCRMVNSAHFCNPSWDLMRKLLGTHLGHSSIYTMCCMLQNKKQKVELLRGAVFYIGMALWGHKKVTSLKQTPSSVLPSFLQVLSTNSYIVGHEVILSVQRLLKKYGKELQYVTWNCILDILESLLKLFETPVQTQQQGFPQMIADLHDILTVVEELYARGHYSGCVSRFFKLIELCATKRSESSVSMLIDYHAQQINPGKENWLNNLFQLLDKYFRCEHRTAIRVKALNVLAFTLSVNKYMHEDDLINTVVLPILCHIENDKDPTVRKVAADILINLAQSCSPASFTEIIGLLDKLITRPMIAHLTSPHPGMEGSDMLQKLDEGHLVDIKTSLIGLVDLFKSKLYTRPSNQCLKLYDLLKGHMKQQYSSPKDYQSIAAANVRKYILEAFLHLRCDSLHRLGFIAKNVDENQFTFSPYVVCQTSEDQSNPIPSSPDQTSSAAFLWSQAALLSYDDIFKMFIDCLEHDKDWQVMECVLVNLPLLLQNKSLVLSTKRYMVDDLCQKLCSMVNDRQLGFPEKLQSVPPGKFTRSDFHTFIFPVLASLVSYHKYLDKNQQRQLIRCLQFGLVSKCSKMCTNSLRICTLEMQDVMMRNLPSVLLQLSKISATVHMAIPVLAFLSSIVRLPKMYANFVEDEYMSVFAIALPYTNPFKFSHYTVSLGHHVIAIWFIRCRIPFRKGFVKFIQKGLKANVLKQFEDNALSHLNQDSSERGRSATINESVMKSRRGRAASGTTSPKHTIPSPPIEEKMSVFHRELTETCMDIMSRYTFANYNAVPQRSQVAEFLLKGGQSQTWILGNKLVTITTSGGNGAKYSNPGSLCDKCVAHYTQQGTPTEQKTPVTPSSSRRRHRSAYVGRSSSMIDNTKSSIDDIGIQSRLSFSDDMNMEEGLDQGIGVQTGSSLTEHTPKSGFESENLESILCGPMNKSADGRMFSNYQCNCWCTGWAEVYIRSPSGVTGWMMRIENETSLTSLQDSQLHDFTILFANFRNNKQPDLDSLTSRIDVDSLGEEEYVTLYDQHFPSDHGSSGGLFAECADNIQVLIDEDNKIGEENGVDIQNNTYKENTSTNENDGIVSLLKRSTSSPSLLETGSNHSSEKDLQTQLLSDINKQYHDSDSHLHKAGIDGTSISTSMDRNHLSASRPTNLTSKSSEVISSSSKLNLAHSAEYSLSPGSSESSAHDEVPDLPAFRKPRGHTINVIPQDRGHEEKTGVKDSGKGGNSPSFVFLQLYFSGLLHAGQEMPILLPQTEASKRSVNMLDRIFPFAQHKIGVIYVGNNQAKDVQSILSNQSGSERYLKFLEGLGQLIRLSDCDPNRVYLGGLNSDGSDGQYCYGWQDETMHVIFHVATLMPNKESDPNCNAKKLHIGNDYVTIVYNESGEDYRIGTIKGQFNYVNIIIKPIDHESNAITLQAKEVPFKDSITTDIAEILGHKDTKVISDQHLADLVRQIAVNCNLASLVLSRHQSNPHDPFASNPLERLRQIKRIKQKALLELDLQNPTDQGHKVEDFTEFV